MNIARRQTMLTLARLEWDAIVHELEETPETADVSTPAVASLRKQLEDCSSDPEEMVTIAQPPVYWSPFIIALSLNVLIKPDLLPVAERLRDQMVSQARRGPDSLSGVGQSSELRRMRLSPRELGRKHANPN